MDLKVVFPFLFKMVVRWVKNVRWQMLFILNIKVRKWKYNRPGGR